MKLKDNDNIFQVSTETARDAALTTVGDSVEMNFIKVGSSRYIIVNSFINNWTFTVFEIFELAA